MIEKIDGSTGWYNRMSKSCLKTKSRIGHVFKNNVYEAIHDMKDCTFQPTTNNKKPPQNKDVFKISERLFKQADQMIQKQNQIRQEYKLTHFTPNITQYNPQDFYKN